ncbi:hypothetical protein [Jiella sonneratiae]|uniref:Uncharacterized protein n=1 Tax=Jiella sonneratiae TaxID=2816856 RepID=A0ABS3J6X5_9HYPH|nr:hypothetical protein [Jiella sonneratiae]MBO0905418.1 hypothetical protein [Jiella sonneratiae]
MMILVAFSNLTFDATPYPIGTHTVSGRSLRDAGNNYAHSPRGLDTSPALIERISYRTSNSIHWQPAAATAPRINRATFLTLPSRVAGS